MPTGILIKELKMKTAFKLSVLTLALLSTTAFADESKTVFYGSVDAAVVNASADGQKSDVEMMAGILRPSYVGLQHSEVVEGQSIHVTLEYALDTSFAGTMTASPVFGLRPVRGGRLLMPKLPKPRISTRPRFTNALEMPSRIVMAASSMSFAVSCGCCEASLMVSSSISSERVISDCV
jgi:hypothetical protein